MLTISLSLYLVSEFLCVLAFPPSTLPTLSPTLELSAGPTSQPFSAPSWEPTLSPTLSPSLEPFVRPSVEPTSRPSKAPSRHPTVLPTLIPTLEPSLRPSREPTSSVPSQEPTYQPTFPVTITSVSPIFSQRYQTIVIQGSGFMPRDGPLFGIIILIMCSKVKKRYCCCHVVQALSSNICTFEATEHIYMDCHCRENICAAEHV